MSKQIKHHDEFLGDLKWHDDRMEWRGRGRFCGINVTIVIDLLSRKRVEDSRLFKDAVRLFRILEEKERILRWQTVLSELDGDFFDFGEGQISPLYLWAHLRPSIVKLGETQGIYYKNERQLGDHFLICNVTSKGIFSGSEMEG